MKNVTSNISVKKNFALSTAYQILTLLTPFITAPYVSRVLGADGIGIYSYTCSIQMYFSMFAALGTMSYGAREIARARNDRERFSQLFWEIESLAVLSSLFCILLWGIWIYFQTQYQIVYLVLTMALVGTMLDISWFFTGLEQFKYIVIRNTIVKIAGIALLFIFIREKDDLVLYIFLMTLTNLLGIMSMWMYIPNMVQRPDLKNFKILPHFRETLVYFIPTIAASLYTILNKVLIGAIGNDPKENGYYEQADKIINMAKMLAFVALNSVMGARMSYLFAKKKEEEIRSRIDRSIDYVLFMGLGLVFGLIGIAPRFVPWFFGPDFKTTAGLIQMLCPIILIIGISNVLGSHYYTPAGLRAKSARYLIYGAVANLCISYFLISRYNSYGAVVSSLTAELLVTILYVYNSNGYLRLYILYKHGWKKMIAGGAMLILMMSIDKTIANNTLAVLCEFLMGGLIYCIILLVIKDTFVLYMAEQISKRIKKHK